MANNKFQQNQNDISRNIMNPESSCFYAHPVYEKAEIHVEPSKAQIEYTHPILNIY